MYLFGVFLALPRHLLGGGERFLAFNEWIVWYSGMPLMLGLGLAIMDLFLLFNYKRSPQLEVRYDPIADPRLVVALTAYDDEASIADATTPNVATDFATIWLANFVTSKSPPVNKDIATRADLNR